MHMATIFSQKIHVEIIIYNRDFWLDYVPLAIPYKSYIWREFSLAFAQLYPIGGHYYWRSIDTEFLSLHLLFLPLEVLPKGCHHRDSYTVVNTYMHLKTYNTSLNHPKGAMWPSLLVEF